MPQALKKMSIQHTFLPPCVEFLEDSQSFSRRHKKIPQATTLI